MGYNGPILNAGGADVALHLEIGKHKSLHPQRIAALDVLRGLTLLSMIAYHTCWDLVYLFRMDWGWYRSTGA